MKLDQLLVDTAKSQGFTIERVDGGYTLRSWEGNLHGPMTRKEMRVWLSGYSFGANAHALDCQCNRVACNFRRMTLRGQIPGGDV